MDCPLLASRRDAESKKRLLGLLVEKWKEAEPLSHLGLPFVFFWWPTTSSSTTILVSTPLARWNTCRNTSLHTRRLMASLEEELGIPADASLVVPTTLPGPIRLSFVAPLHSPPPSTPSSNPSRRRSSDVGVSVVSTVVVSPASSSRNCDDAATTPRCLIVGRQASASDVA